MHEYYSIKNRIAEILIPLHYAEISENTERDCYGSIDSIYAKGENRFMIQWDGEEGFGSVEVWQKTHWVQLKSIVPESGKEEFNKSLSNLCSELGFYS